uniref:Rho-GAP domain-containing protein n=1 Tax=Knipowitschia caucasica TaxID=637954 RepID=A0AAV2JSK9_KNICA
MTECFLPPTSSPAEQRRTEHPGAVARTPSSEEISPTKFPGLYRTGEPSPSHDGHHHELPDVYVSDDDKEHSKKKNKFKKKEKRTEGYAAFQEDSSADEAESPSKMKRSKGIHVFKKPSFSKKKEKDFKVKEKVSKEDKSKDKKSKDLTAADVVKQWKDKKKKKKPGVELDPSVAAAVVVEVPTVRPVFGAPLGEAVKRTALYDAVQLPAVFRECVDYIENYGMKCEGIYRVSGMKSKVDELKAAYDREECPCLEEYDPHTVASLLKQYLRELPENLLGRDLGQRFEDACGRSLEAEKVAEFQRLLSEVCPGSFLLLSWLITHMDNVIAREADTKMNIQNISIVLNPTIQSVWMERFPQIFSAAITHFFLLISSSLCATGMCNPKNYSDSPATSKSTVEELHRPIPSLFRALTEGDTPINMMVWSFPVAEELSHHENLVSFLETLENQHQNVSLPGNSIHANYDGQESMCTVVYFDDCVPSISVSSTASLWEDLSIAGSTTPAASALALNAWTMGLKPSNV